MSIHKGASIIEGWEKGIGWRTMHLYTKALMEPRSHSFNQAFRKHMHGSPQNPIQAHRSQLLLHLAAKHVHSKHLWHCEPLESRLLYTLSILHHQFALLTARYLYVLRVYTYINIYTYICTCYFIRTCILVWCSLTSSKRDEVTESVCLVRIAHQGMLVVLTILHLGFPL